MGRSKKGFNSKARRKVEGHLADESQVQQLQKKLGVESGLDEEYGSRQADDSNALVLPARKRKFKETGDSEGTERTKLLSRYALPFILTAL